MQDPSDWTLTSPGGIKHRLIQQKGNFGQENASWTQEIIIQSIDFEAFILECFPQPIDVGDGTIEYPRRFYPAGLPSLECQKVDVEGLTSGKPIDPYAAGTDLFAPELYDKTFEPYLRVTIQYGTSPANDMARDKSKPLTFLEINASESGEFLSHEVNQEDVEWEDDDGESGRPDEKDTDLHRTIVATEVEWTCRWPQIPFTFFQTILKGRLHEAMGKVNDDTIALFGNAPAETILFLGYSRKYEFTWRRGFSGVSPVEVTIRFLEKNFKGKQKPIPGSEESGPSAESGSSASGPASWQDVDVTHNHIYRTNRGWQRLLINGLPLYEQHDMMKIFLG